MKTKIKNIIMALVIFFIGVSLILGSYVWFLNKMRRVQVGTARPTFPYSDYSLDELNKLYPQYIENTVPTTQTPEQTHEKFVAALKKGDLDEAVKCCVVEGNKAKMTELLESVKQKNMWNIMLGDISDIKKDVELGDRVGYIYSGTYKGEKIGNTIMFSKDSQGVWLIESL